MLYQKIKIKKYPKSTEKKKTKTKKNDWDGSYKAEKLTKDPFYSNGILGLRLHVKLQTIKFSKCFYFIMFPGWDFF